MLRSPSSPPTSTATEGTLAPPEPVARKSVPLPRAILQEEAVTLLRLLRRHWEPRISSTGELEEGFVSIGESRLPRSTADALEALIAKLDAEDRAAATIGRGHIRERADVGRAMHASLASVAKAAFLRTIHPAQASQARELEKVHIGASSAVEVAHALEGYASFLTEHAAIVDGLGGFGPAQIAEARALATELRAYGCPEAQKESKRLFAARPQTALDTHLVCQRIRHYAKFLFRTKPELYRQFTSVYLRVQRARLRRQVVVRAKRGY